METILTVMSFMGGMIIGATLVLVAVVFLINVKNDFNNSHARLIPKAKPTKVRKVEIYKTVAKSLKKQKLFWVLKFKVNDGRPLNVPVATIGEDFFYVRSDEAGVVYQDLVTDLRRRGYEVDIDVNGKGDVTRDGPFTDDINMINEVKTITLTVKVK